MTVLELPDPPTANLYWRHFRGRVVKSARARAYQSQVAWLAKQQGAQPILTGEIKVTFVWRRRKRIGDLDNKQKVLFDALKGIAWKDDAQIAEIHAMRLTRPERPGVTLTIDRLQDELL